ncbi:MAG: DUF4301 family protein [Deltaproteobacteria bacterium]|nr:DUF4301 family protein [Deltaproteobacteria bacterium]
MLTPAFTEAERKQMETLGVTEAQVLDQLEVFNKSAFYVRLNRPCTVGDGIHQVSAEDIPRYLDLHEEGVRKGRFSKFVPASGAATRMFHSLLQIYYLPYFLEPGELHRKAEQGVSVAVDFLLFLENLKRFPFHEDLAKAVSNDGLSLSRMIEEHQYRLILEYLLTEIGLAYGVLPKGLLKFHRYREECRTAFEEHLMEAVDFVGRGSSSCRIHFTVSPEHRRRFEELLEQVGPLYEARLGASYSVDFSLQKPSTSTIAVDRDNRPFKDRSGQLVFRPGGHGALLENLNDLKGDLIYVKNVDNVAPDRLKGPIGHWKRILGGYLMEVQDQVHAYVRRLLSGIDRKTTEEVAAFAAERLLLQFPRAFQDWPWERKYVFLLGRLNRPIRVCGVVKNVGEPGGAPFWVEDKRRGLSIQIVEKAQVRFTSSTQKKIWNASTHFNPVDLVCGVKDFEGRHFDLRRYVDHDAVFISEKSKDGRTLKALELPGLWNGAMADWISVMVEVPRITFNPVKTVFDLLKPEHQAEAKHSETVV